MSIFKKKHEGGLMDVIRCDEPTYLIWKWRPKGSEEANSTKKENAIRYGSSLRVKDGEVAIFVYPQKSGPLQEYIEGPFDQTIKTANLPILTSIVGAAFGGASPFQAEVYSINLAGIIQVKFGVPFFDVADARNTNFTVPVAVRGSINFRVTNYKEFIKLHRLIDFDLVWRKLYENKLDSSFDFTRDFRICRLWFFSGTGNMLLTVGSGAFLFATLFGMFGISFGRGSANIKIFSGIFLVLVLVEHLIFVFSGFRQTAYIVITGILFLLYLLIFYGIIKALKEE